MARPVDVENLRGVFHKVMQANQLNSKDVKKERSQIPIYDLGQFDCGACCRKWRSKFSWITFDLMEMKITYRWKMKCRNCLMVCEPTFTKDQLEGMYDKAVRCYKGEKISHAVNVGYRAYGPRTQPHLPPLCEKCRWGIEQCWLKCWHC